ncbi:MAG: ABC transporter ATP-binding protein [Acidimicrobiales bacterium]
MTETVIDVVGLTKRYDHVDALRGVGLQVKRGEVVAVLGPNGAGKTTMVEIMEGYRERAGGTVDVLGVDPARADAAWRSRIGIVHQSSTASDELTVQEVVGFHAAMYPNPLTVGEALGRVGLSAKARERCSRLSGGLQRRLDVALGIVGRPEILFLDEPTTGLDPEARRDAWSMVESLAGTTILLTTHYMEEAERLADRVAVMVKGRIVSEGTPTDIGGRRSGDAVVRARAKGILSGDPPSDLADVLRRRGDWIEIHTQRPTRAVGALAAWAATGGLAEVPGLEISRPSLEDIYLVLTAGSAASADPDRNPPSDSYRRSSR